MYGIPMDYKALPILAIAMIMNVLALFNFCKPTA